MGGDSLASLLTSSLDEEEDTASSSPGSVWPEGWVCGHWTGGGWTSCCSYSKCLRPLGGDREGEREKERDRRGEAEERGGEGGRERAVNMANLIYPAHIVP